MDLAGLGPGGGGGRALKHAKQPVSLHVRHRMGRRAPGRRSSNHSRPMTVLSESAAQARRLAGPACQAAQAWRSSVHPRTVTLQ